MKFNLILVVSVFVDTNDVKYKLLILTGWDVRLLRRGQTLLTSQELKIYFFTADTKPL